MEGAKVVARYANGDVLKGFTNNFSPMKECFHVFPTGNGSGNPVEVSIRDLKAVFLVRGFEGDSEYHERKRYLPGELPLGRKIEVTFNDGEVLVGSTLNYHSNRQGFFVYPVDPKSNNIRVFAVSCAVQWVRQL